MLIIIYKYVDKNIQCLKNSSKKEVNGDYSSSS